MRVLLKKNVEFMPVSADDDVLFHALLDAYYREGEDAETPPAEIDGFIQYLFDLCLQGQVRGSIAVAHEPVGFVLWNIDKPDSPFSNIPGYGTILEIGVEAKYRKAGIGRMLVSHAEEELRKAGVPALYVCAYGPAESFWLGCGYLDAGRIARNGLKILEKR